MRIIADIHTHSRFSRACSPELTIPNLDKWAKIKGVNLITVADFTQPAWLKECEQMLIADGSSGFYFYKEALRSALQPGGLAQGQTKNLVRFMFTTELAFIYKQGGKTRRIHNVILAPNLSAAKKLNKELERRGFNLHSDGRPILGMPDKDFLKLIKELDEDFELIPAHVWTPWFAIFGSKSGYDSVEECYGEMSKYIFALETGLSSDPPMNWRVSQNDPYILVSNSDSHSLQNIGREANVFELAEDKITYQELIRILKEKDLKRFLYTIEFFPEEGMYHYDGHRDCQVSLPPQETRRQKGICPKCKKPLTIGVDYRVEELADRDLGFVPGDKPGFRKLIELDKIIAQCLGIKSRNSKQVIGYYEQLIQQFGSELNILLDLSEQELTANNVEPIIVEGIKRVRAGELQIKPGYDGTYGEINIFSDLELVEMKPQQKKLF